MRCFTVLLTCGWFLMSPPRVGDGPEVNARRPLTEWIHQRSFDTAQSCEQFRSRLIVTTMNQAGDTAVYTRNVAAEGKCVPSDLHVGTKE